MILTFQWIFKNYNGLVTVRRFSQYFTNEYCSYLICISPWYVACVSSWFLSHFFTPQVLRGTALKDLYARNWAQGVLFTRCPDLKVEILDFELIPWYEWDLEILGKRWMHFACRRRSLLWPKCMLLQVLFSQNGQNSILHPMYCLQYGLAIASKSPV